MPLFSFFAMIEMKKNNCCLVTYFSLTGSRTTLIVSPALSLWFLASIVVIVVVVIVLILILMIIMMVCDAGSSFCPFLLFLLLFTLALFIIIIIICFFSFVVVFVDHGLESTDVVLGMTGKDFLVSIATIGIVSTAL